MKKKFRKFFAVVAATVMVLAMGMVSVNASDVQPRGPLCPLWRNITAIEVLFYMGNI